MGKKVIGMGNALVDLLLRRDDEFCLKHQLPKGSMNLVEMNVVERLIEGTEDYRISSGGCAANTIHGLARFGVPAAFIGKVGDDDFGSFFKKDLSDAGVVPALLKGSAATGRAAAIVTPDSERTFATYLGAAIELCPDDLSKEIFSGYDYFHIEGYLVQNHDLIRHAVELAKEAGCQVSIDMASYNVVEDNLEFLKEIVSGFIDIVFANEDEAKAFTGKEEGEALEEISIMCSIAVVKLGSKGSLAKRGEEKVSVGVIPAQALDSTGAGDLYASGFLYGLTQGLSLEKCCRLGALSSGKVVEVLGAKMEDAVWKKIESEAEKIVQV